jgi:hypothetical protein
MLSSALRLVPLLALLLALLAVPGRAHAHQTSVVYLDVTVDGRAVDLSARITAEDLGEPLDLSPLLTPTRAQARTRAERAARYVAERITVHNGDSLCTASPGTPSLQERDDTFALSVPVRYECGRQIDALRLRYELFFDLDPQHQGLARVHAFGSSREAVLRGSERELQVQGTPSRRAQFAEFFVLGVEHIFTGYDHIAFLFGLLVIAGARGLRRGGRETLTIVTAFTLAHSLTLLAAALGWIRLPSRLVESAIALSILYVALENLRTAAPRHRWGLTFAFGLVHGFGFAGVLAELGLPARGLALSLVGFNLGVEAGQLLVVAAAFPVLLTWHRSRWRSTDLLVLGALPLLLVLVLARAGVPLAPLAVVVGGGTVGLSLATRRWGYGRAVRGGTSVLLAALAALWLLERVLERQWFGGRLG